MKKRVIYTTLILYIVLSIFSNAFAADLKTKLEVIEQASETKYLENDQGYISKTIVDSNADTGEVTIELKMSNTSKETETEKTLDTEIFLVVDNSPSMDFVTSTGETRKELVLNSAKELVTSIFDSSANAKIGLIDFHGKTKTLFVGEDASINNAVMRQKLTNNKESVLSAIQSEFKISTLSGTNIEAGLIKAQQNFSKNVHNKIIILLTDGIPNASVDGTNSGNKVTEENAIKVQENTKQTLVSLKENGIYTITLLTGMSETDGNTDKEGNEFEKVNTIEEELAAAERIFGTETKPTADKYYLVRSADINSIITNDILRDVTEKIQNPINTAKIVDYFPNDIAENFEFSYVGKPSIGTASEKIDEQKNTIEWDIGTLRGNEIATLRYKLKIKDMKNQDLLNKTIATNEKVVLTYKDNEQKNYEVILSTSPKIQLSKIEEEKVEKPKEEKPITNNNNNNVTNSTTIKDREEDTTTATTKIPQTGVSIMPIISIIVIAIFGLVALKLYVKNRDIE